MFERLLKGMAWLAAFGELLFSQKLFTLQLGNALLIGRHNRAAARIHDAIKELINLFFKLLDVRLNAFRILRRFSKADVPRVAEHGLHQPKQPL
ncbi:MAG: hypothetical protein ACEPO2_02025 [Pelagibaca sp.]